MASWTCATKQYDGMGDGTNKEQPSAALWPIHPAYMVGKLVRMHPRLQARMSRVDWIGSHFRAPHGTAILVKPVD